MHTILPNKHAQVAASQNEQHSATEQLQTCSSTLINVALSEVFGRLSYEGWIVDNRAPSGTYSSMSLSNRNSQGNIGWIEDVTGICQRPAKLVGHVENGEYLCGIRASTTSTCAY